MMNIFESQSSVSAAIQTGTREEGVQRERDK